MEFGVKIDFIHPNTEFDVKDGLKQVGIIKKWEKIIETKTLVVPPEMEEENLITLLEMEEKVPNFVIIAEPQRKKHNIQFSDKNTLVALRDIEIGEKLVVYYPQWVKKRITAPNMFVYYLAQFWTVLGLIIIVILWIALFT